jgi:hypothetical protein
MDCWHAAVESASTATRSVVESCLMAAPKNDKVSVESILHTFERSWVWRKRNISGVGQRIDGEVGKFYHTPCVPVVQLEEKTHGHCNSNFAKICFGWCGVFVFGVF